MTVNTEDDIRDAIVATMTFREALAELASSGVPVDKLAAFYRRAAAVEIVRAWLARPQEQPRKATGEGWWVQPEWRDKGDNFPRGSTLVVDGITRGDVYEKTYGGYAACVGERLSRVCLGDHFSTREEAQAALIAAIRPDVSVPPAATQGEK